MTEQERIELLKQVVECAPKEMGAFYDEDCTSCDFSAYDERMWFTLYAGQSDVAAGPAIFAMLDAMEKAGYYTLLGWASDVENHYPVDGRYACQVINGKYDRVVEREGTTRVEAAARAFVQVFGSIDRRPGA